MSDDDTGEDWEMPEEIEIPIDGVLDLHPFHPRDTKTLIPDYLEECRKQGITEVRIIHGKGTGALKKSVHALLGRSDIVLKFALCGEDAGGWGATRVDLRPLDDDDDAS